jgi:hypothetical protein
VLSSELKLEKSSFGALFISALRGFSGKCLFFIIIITGSELGVLIDQLTGEQRPVVPT